MAKELVPLDVSRAPELLQLSEEVRKSGRSRVLRRDQEDLAIVVPITGKPRAKRSTAQSDYEAFLSSAGSWKGLVDRRALRRTIREGRSSDRPSVRL